MRLMTNVYRIAPTGGLELNVFQVSRELTKRGHVVDLMYVEGGSLEPEYRSFCHSVQKVITVDYSFPRHRLRRVLRERAQLAPTTVRAIMGRPDVLYGNRVSSTGWTVPAKHVTRTPIVTHLHGFTDLGPDRTRWLSRNVDRFAIVSRYTAGLWLDAGMSPEKAEVIYNGIDPEHYPMGGADERAAARHALGIPEDAFVVTYIGRIDVEKGLETLIDAWRRLGLERDEGRLLAVGSPMVHDDPAAYLAQLAERGGETARFIPAQQDVVTPLHAADVAVVPSVWEEPFGRTVIEGLSTGRPVVGSRVGAIPEILTGDLERFLFDAGDDEALSVILRGLMGWQSSEPELAAACRARVVEEFTLAHAVDSLERMFNDVR